MAKNAVVISSFIQTVKSWNCGICAGKRPPGFVRIMFWIRENSKFELMNYEVPHRPSFSLYWLLHTHVSNLVIFYPRSEMIMIFSFKLESFREWKRGVFIHVETMGRKQGCHELIYTWELEFLNLKINEPKTKMFLVIPLNILKMHFLV